MITLGKQIFCGNLPTPQTLRHINVESITLVTPPMVLSLGLRDFLFGGETKKIRVEAHFYDVGVISITAFFTTENIEISDWIHSAIQIQKNSQVESFLDELLNEVLAACQDAIINPHPVADFYEKFTCYQLRELEAPITKETLLEMPELFSMMHGEKRPLSRQQIELMHENTFSFYENDCVTLNYNNALVVGEIASEDLLVLIEYAVTQVLEVRYYDITLNNKLLLIYSEMDKEISFIKMFFSKQWGNILHRAMKLNLESRLAIDGLTSSVRVTENVYYAQIYNRSLEIFRTEQWLNDITSKLEALQGVCEMMNDKIESRRSSFLEGLVSALVVFEFVPFLYELLQRIYAFIVEK